MFNEKFNIFSFIITIKNLFKKKYTVNILDSKWQVISEDVKLEKIPRQDEYIWSGTRYYQVINIVHIFNKKQQILIIVEELTSNEITDIQ